MTALRILLADDHPLLLAGLRALVEAEPDILVVAEAADGHAGVAEARRTQPDIAVLDISMPGLNGADAAAEVLAGCPNCRIIVLTVHEERSYVQRLLQIGVHGYVLKRSAARELVRAIRAVAAGGIYLDPAIAGEAIGRPKAGATGPAPAADLAAELSDREEHVLRLTASGHSNKAMANQLGISVRTVETHKAHGMEKLRLRSRVELLRYAMETGWLETP